jgi:hypothetical protein
MLPKALRWEDEARAVVEDRKMQPVDQEPHEADVFRYARNIQVALLRTRYYYAQYMIYRPLVYKALHYPAHMTAQDVHCVVVCLQVGEQTPLSTP